RAGGAAMSSSPIRTITQREVSDTLTDWRILIPMFILSFVLPEVLISGANFAVRFIGDANTISRLVPFVMLLVGFIPASFVLITFKALVMVASAVIISSHTTSVRAANLLASFVLLPTAAVVQLEAILIISRGPNSRSVLWLTALLLSVMAVALIRTGMGAF